MSVGLALRCLPCLLLVEAGIVEYQNSGLSHSNTISSTVDFTTTLSSPFRSYRDSPTTIRSTRTNENIEYPSRRSLRSSGSITIPMFQGYGAHYVELNVGTPPQPQTFLLDTGSATIGIPCNECVECGGKRSHNDFDQSKSKTFAKVECGDCLLGHCDTSHEDQLTSPNQTDTCVVETNYLGGCSWKGNEVIDYVVPSFGKVEGNKIVASDNVAIRSTKEKESVHILDGQEVIMSSAIEPRSANRHSFKLKYSCMTTAAGQFKTQLSNGIAGMGLSEMSFWRQMYNNNALESKKFSMCVAKSIFPGDAAGALTLGGSEDRLNDSDMEYLNLHNEDGMYGVKIRKIFVHKYGGETLRDMDLGKPSSFVPVRLSETVINSGGVILDSGTTNTYLSGNIREAFDNAWQEVMGEPFPSKPMKIESDELRDWPTIVFQMEGKVQPKEYRESETDVHLKDTYMGDVLVAFPPSHYMQINTRTNKFEPRFIMGDDYGK